MNSLFPVSPTPGLLLCLLACLAGCAGTASLPEVSSQPRTLVYICGDFEFVVHTRGREASLYLPRSEHELALAASDEGVLYRKDEVSLWLRGKEGVKARLELGSERHGQCKLDRSRVPWEEARRRGVDFRAVGQEPGWHLEIEHGGPLLFVYDYGSHRFLGQTPEPAQDGEETVYRLEQADSVLNIELRVEHCQDAMSGEYYDNSALLVLDGREYRGCGMSLTRDW